MSHKKQIFKPNVLKRFINDEKSCVSLMPTTRLLALPPFFLNDMKSGILYILNSMLKKYDRSLGGIVIGYQNIKVLLDENTGIIPIGTSETEVNISVDFYIFQPKIGNYLEGVINKKSNNHIGCLVHQYFNATILKPEDVDYEDWLCKDFNVDDKIIFRVKDLDFTSVLPYIEGVIDEEMSDKVKTKVSKNCDMNNVIINNVKSGFLSKDSTYSESRSVGENKNVSLLKTNVSTILGETDHFVNSRKRDSKKKKEKMKLTLDDNCKAEQEKCSNDEVISVTVNNSKSELDKSHSEKKKKKKTQNDDKGNVQDVFHNMLKEESERITHIILEKYQSQIEDKNCSDSVKPIKHKKRKKGEEETSVASQCLSSKEPEDNVFYSTLIEPMLSKKMRMPFFSPIVKGTPSDAKKHENNPATQSTDTPTDLSSQDGKEKKRKHKKRKREKDKEPDDVSVSKKIKVFSDSPLKKEASEEIKLEMQRMMEEMYKQQLKRVKEELNMSGKETFNEIKKKKEKKKPAAVEESFSKTTKANINGAVGIEEQTLQELQKVKERLTMTDKESCKDSKKKKKSSKAKEKMRKDEKDKNTTTQLNGLNGNEKFEIQNSQDELLQLELNKMKEELKMSETEGKKKSTEKPETTHYSLYDKLLKQAKRVIDLKNDDSSSEKKKNKKNNDLQLSTSSKKERTHGKQKTEHCHETADKYKNGSMYDVTETPEKVNFDKSLFSDSENSRTSPVKRNWREEVNGIEEEPLVQITLNDCRKEKSMSDKESLRKKEKKKKSKQTSQSFGLSTAGCMEESLYEKLLKEAKSLVELPPKKKKKSS